MPSSSIRWWSRRFRAGIFPRGRTAFGNMLVQVNDDGPHVIRSEGAEGKSGNIPYKAIRHATTSFIADRFEIPLETSRARNKDSQNWNNY